MDVNFREALSLLSRALPVLLARAVLYMAAGFMVILLFAALAVASHLEGGLPAIIIFIAPPLIILDAVFTVWVLERFVLYRQQAAMLYLFSGRSASSPGSAGALHDVSLLFPGNAGWGAAKRRVRAFVARIHRNREEFPLPPEEKGGAAGLLASGPLSRAILALAFCRHQGEWERAVREAVALYLRNGAASRDSARRWLRFSTAALVALFLAFALPNAYLFRSAGAPVWIAAALAAAIAWLLYQAFIVPLALAGVSAALLAETRDRIPDSELSDKLVALFPGPAPAVGR